MTTEIKPTPSEHKARRLSAQHERKRRALWLDVFIQSITATNDHNQRSFAADRALQAFDARFPDPI